MKTLIHIFAMKYTFVLQFEDTYCHLLKVEYKISWHQNQWHMPTSISQSSISIYMLWWCKTFLQALQKKFCKWKYHWAPLLFVKWWGDISGSAYWTTLDLTQKSGFEIFLGYVPLSRYLAWNIISVTQHHLVDIDMNYYVVVLFDC